MELYFVEYIHILLKKKKKKKKKKKNAGKIPGSAAPGLGSAWAFISHPGKTHTIQTSATFELSFDSRLHEHLACSGSRCGCYGRMGSKRKNKKHFGSVHEIKHEQYRKSNVI